MKKIVNNPLNVANSTNYFFYQLLVFVICCVIMVSCSHVYYVPPTHNVPLFKEKNEVRVAGNYSEDVGKEFDVQAAYSISEKFAIMANFCSVKDDVSDPQHSYGKGNYFDAAFGFYKPIQKHFVFEIYGGVGNSKQKHRYIEYNEPVRTADLSFVSIFLQPNIGFTTNVFDIAIATRFSNITFHSIKDNTLSGSTDHEHIARISSNRSSFLIEPSLTLRAGWKYVKLQIQTIYSKHMTNEYLGFHDYRASLGLSFAFAERFKKKGL